MQNESEKIVPRMLTIRQVAQLGILPEHALRGMRQRGELPGFECGSRFYVNLTRLIEKLEAL